MSGRRMGFLERTIVQINATLQRQTGALTLGMSTVPPFVEARFSTPSRAPVASEPARLGVRLGNPLARWKVSVEEEIEVVEGVVQFSVLMGVQGLARPGSSGRKFRQRVSLV